MSRFRLAGFRLLRLAGEDIRSGLRRTAQIFGYSNLIPHDSPAVPPIQQRNGQFSSSGQVFSVTRPVIFASACVDERRPGGWKYNGGIKELNHLVKLLRNHGYEAYMVTYDGSYEHWLIDHQPHISIEEFRSKLKVNTDVRCVTSWAVATTFIHECQRLYFWDMELSYTEHAHFSVLASLYKQKLKRAAAISRTIQAWHMAHFERPCTILPNILDESLWSPIDSHRNSLCVGYMNEGQHTEECVALVRDAVKSSGIDLEFLLIKGSEADVLAGMRSCAVFLGMNLGKDPLWGEGCPRTIIEALSVGCIPVAFDIIGNRETIQSGFNGILIPRYRPDLMANALIDLYKTPEKIEQIRANALSLLQACHTFDRRWPAVKEFLELDGA